MSTSMCLCVCPRAYRPNYTRDYCQFFVHVVYRRGSVLLQRVTKSQGEEAILGIFSPLTNAFYNIAFNTHTGMMTLGWALGTMY